MSEKSYEHPETWHVLTRAIVKDPVTSCEARELNSETWPEFEKLFSKFNGVQAGCWCMFYHRKNQTPGKNPEEWSSSNYRDKKELVSKNRSHGILIFVEGNPVGWCQYGPREELPRIDNGRIYRKLERVTEKTVLWRISCFFVDTGYRRRGVAEITLKEALKRIEEAGGGIVEAYPVTHSRAVPVYFGTTAMFEKHGFRIISQPGKSNVLMRKTL